LALLIYFAVTQRNLLAGVLGGCVAIVLVQLLR
jgi:hypothetical protein